MACVCLVEGFVGHETSLWIFLLLPAASQTLVVVAGVLARDSSTRPPPRNTLGYQDLHAAPDCGRRVHRLVVGRRKVAGGSDSNFHFIICTLCGLCCRNGISRQLALTIWDGGALPN